MRQSRLSVMLTMPIRAYWLLWPSKWRRRCIYKESCSRYVYRVTTSDGLAEGLRALQRRWRSCRQGYELESRGSMLGLRLCDGTFVPESEVSDFLICAVRQQLDSLRAVDAERDKHATAVPTKRLPITTPKTP
jgi:putative component of membrane protein insertase Oxa1/YidC/SpoIIIJ protein YidD